MSELTNLKRQTRWIEQLPVARGRPLLGAVVMLAIVAGGLALRMATDPLLPPGFPYVTFFPAVIITSFLFGCASASFRLLCAACSPVTSSYHQPTASR